MTKLIICLLGVTPALALAQSANTDSLRRAQRGELERFRTQSTSAAATFLDRSRPAEARLAAVNGLNALTERQQTDSAVAIVLDRREPTEVRARALQLASHRVGEDTSFSARLFPLATDTATPLALRLEVVKQLSFATFGTLTMQAQHDRLIAALRAAGRDPDLRIRRLALGALAGQGDEPTLDQLRDGLLAPPSALLPPSEAVQLLGVSDPTPSFGVLRRVMLAPPDSATRAAAIQVLGRDPSSRGDLVRVLRDPGESLGMRQAALGALVAGDPAGLPRHVLPVVGDEAAPLDLRLRALTAVELARTSRDPRVFARAADDFDQQMERLSTRSTSTEMRAAARRYLARTRAPR